MYVHSYPRKKTFPYANPELRAERDAFMLRRTSEDACSRRWAPQTNVGSLVRMMASTLVQMNEFTSHSGAALGLRAVGAKMQIGLPRCNNNGRVGRSLHGGKPP